MRISFSIQRSKLSRNETMSLLKQWRANPEQIASKHVRQIIAFAGDGRIKDGNLTATEFREFLAEIPSSFLSRFANECLEDKFEDSGFVLQDVVNEIGRRLGFRVENGRYRGSQNQIGNDGIWFIGTKRQILIEVKTTDAYRIDLDRIAGYRLQRIRANELTEENSSILIVVGRTDTGDMEAQIRGSRHAWGMRLISVDSLVKLMRVKESLDDPETLSRVHDVLVPREYTKLDDIVLMLFSTAEDAQQVESIDEETKPNNQERQATFAAEGKKFIPVAFHEACALRVSKHLGTPLVKRTRAFFSSPDETVRVVCAISKEHDSNAKPNYWYAFHPHQGDLLGTSSSAYVAFGCGSAERTLCIPYKDFLPWLDGMNRTVKDDREYWHVQIFRTGEKLVLVRRQGESKIDLNGFLVR